MIIIELTYKVTNPSGGAPINHLVRKAFADDDVDGVNEFLDSEPEEYGWHNRSYEYIKL